MSKPAFLQQEKPVLYTTTPPRDANDMVERAEALAPVLADSRIHAISAPELITRVAENGYIAYELNTVAPEDFLAKLETTQERIPTFIVPRIPKAEFLSRLEQVRATGLNTAILVGPEHHEDVDVLGGYTLLEGSKIAAEQGFTLGAITIPWRKTRTCSNPNEKPLVEYERLAVKQQNGCSFATSQLVFESDSATQLIRDYGAHCKDYDLEPLTIFFSFCLVARKKTLDFLYDLDVDIPATQRRRLLGNEDIVAESLQLAAEIWGAIKDTQKSDAPNIPIGLQIEQIAGKRVDRSLSLLDHLDSV